MVERKEGLREREREGIRGTRVTGDSISFPFPSHLSLSHLSLSSLSFFLPFSPVARPKFVLSLFWKVTLLLSILKFFKFHFPGSQSSRGREKQGMHFVKSGRRIVLKLIIILFKWWTINFIDQLALAFHQLKSMGVFPAKVYGKELGNNKSAFHQLFPSARKDLGMHFFGSNSSYIFVILPFFNQLIIYLINR